MPHHVNFPAVNSIFSCPITSTFNAMCFDKKIFSHASAKRGTKRIKRVQISRFYWSFSSDIMAVKGLKPEKQTNKRENKIPNGGVVGQF